MPALLLSLTIWSSLVIAAAPPTPAELASTTPGYHDLLAGSTPTEGSVSIGMVTRGRLIDGVQLPLEGPHHTVLEMCRDRDTRWGTSELIRLVHDVAATVAERAPGARLAVCNMSRPGGRRMPWSRSHRAGRDVDLAFFVRDAATDQAIDAPGLIPMRFDGMSLGQDPPRYAFDFPRNWELVRALAMNDETPIQWIFVRHGLRRRLLRHARAIGEPAALIERVALTMKEPSDAARHDDHFHVRLFCTAEDRGAGCRDDDPRWPWFDPDPLPLAARAAALSYGVRDPDPAVRLATLEAIVELDAMDAAPALAELAIFEPAYEVRARAASILLEWNAHVGKTTVEIIGWSGAQPRTHRQRACDELVVAAIEGFIRSPGPGLAVDDPVFTAPLGTLAADMPHAVAPWLLGEGRQRERVHLSRAWKLLTKLATPASVPFLERALMSQRVLGDPASPDDGTPEARLAAVAAGHVMDLRIVPALLDSLAHEDRRVRSRVDTALRRVTNHTQSGARWGTGVDRERLVSQTRWWRDWWGEREGIERDELVRQGFRRRGQRFLTLDDDANIPKLVRLTKRKDELGYNADRLLVRITGRHTPRAWTPVQKYTRWTSWFP